MDTANPQYLTSHLERIEAEVLPILPNAIDTDLIRTIKAELAPYLQGLHPGRNDFEGLYSERVYALLSKAPSIAKIIEHSDVLAILDRLLPVDYLLSAALAINVHPGETPQPMYIDDNSGKFAVRLTARTFRVSTI